MRYNTDFSMEIYRMTEEEEKVIQKFLNIKVDEHYTIKDILAECDELYFDFTSKARVRDF